MGSFFLFLGLILLSANGISSFADSAVLDSSTAVVAVTMLTLGFLVKVPM